MRIFVGPFWPFFWGLVGFGLFGVGDVVFLGICRLSKVSLIDCRKIADTLECARNEYANE